MKKAFIAVALVTLVALVAGPAAAGGRGNTRGGSSGTLRFSSDHIVAGSAYQVIGTGFRPNTWVSVGARYGTTYWGSGVTNGNGDFAFTFTAHEAGSIVHDAYEQGNNGRWRLVSTATLTTYPS
jgi:hypothetical protein